MNLNILYEDTHLLVLQKPAGVPVQSKGFRTNDIESMLKTYLREQNPETGAPYIGVIHRLDQPVEGILVFAKNPVVAKELCKQNTSHQMTKRYLALQRNVKNVDNTVDKWITLVDYLWKDGKTNTSKIVSKGTSGGKESKLSYRIVDKKEEIQLVEVELFTGRHHQIRVQMAGHDLPLLGDQKYGCGKVEKYPVENIALCAYFLSFTHPKTKKKMEFKIQPQNLAFQNFL